MISRHRVILGVVALAVLATVIMYNALTTLFAQHSKYPGRHKSGYQKLTPRMPEQKPGKAPRIILRSIQTEQDINKNGSGFIANVSKGYKDLKKSNFTAINSKEKDLLTKDRQQNLKNNELKDVLFKMIHKNKSALNSVNLLSKISNKETNRNSILKRTVPIDNMKNYKSIHKPLKSKYVNEKYKHNTNVGSLNSIPHNNKGSDPGRGWWRTHLCQPSPAPWRYKEVKSKPITLSSDITYLESTEKNIFLLETSCAQVLGPRIWCAVESLSHKHPDHQVTLFLTSPTLNDAPGQEYLRADGQRHILPNNVHLVYVDLEDIFMGSVLEKVYLSGTWYSIPDLTVLNVSDILRVLLVHKYGGIYLDLDIINIKALDDLTNFVGRQDNLIANGIFGFKKGHWFLSEVLDMISTNFMAGPRGHNGPEVFTKAVLEECGDKALHNHKQTAICKGLNILAPASFYPVPYSRWETYFTPGKGKVFIKSWSKAYVLHFWNEFSSKKRVALGSGSAYDFLASLHCPRLYREVMHSSKWLL